MSASLLVPNFRDVGETVNKLLGRRVLKERVLLRGGEIDFVENLDVIFAPRTIINLRRAGDREYGHVITFHKPAPNSVEVYAVGSGDNRRWILSVLNVLVEELSGPPYYIHCAAGKDRTGVVIAAILTAIGVERDIVVREYELSCGLLRSKLLADALDQFEQKNYFMEVDLGALRARFLER